MLQQTPDSSSGHATGQESGSSRIILRYDCSGKHHETEHDMTAETPVPGEAPAPFPTRLKPMLARLVQKPFSHPDWLFEPKLDGYRALAFVRHGEVTLRSRNENDLTDRYPEVVEELEGRGELEVVLDGEIVALDPSGLPDFGLLQNSSGFGPGRGFWAGRASSSTRRNDDRGTITYYPFDLLYRSGSSLLQAPLSQRKTALAEALSPTDRVRLVDHVEAEGETFFEAAVKMGLEGMVAKRVDSLYRPGARTDMWLKVKASQYQDFVVGGYTKGSGARAPTFASLVVGQRKGDELVYAGRVGSGYDNATLEQLRSLLEMLETARCPFADHPELSNIDARWVRPKLTVHVRFAEWTHENILRAPVFLGVK